MFGNQRTISKLKDARRLVIGKAVQAKKERNYKEKIRWELRREYIKKQIDEIEGVNKFSNRVFISYSKSSGEIQYQLVKKMLEKNEFEVTTGFDPIEKDEGIILKRVIKQLKSSSFYIGILTREEEVIAKNKSKWIPSVWVIEEKGMALALQLPFALLIDERIDKKYWIKTTPDKLHYLFNESSFCSIAKLAVKHIIDRFEEIYIKGISYDLSV